MSDEDLDQNLQHLHGDDLTWALFRVLRADTKSVKARMNLLVGLFGAGTVVLGAILGVLVMHP